MQEYRKALQKLRQHLPVNEGDSYSLLQHMITESLEVMRTVGTRPAMHNLLERLKPHGYLPLIRKFIVESRRALHEDEVELSIELLVKQLDQPQYAGVYTPLVNKLQEKLQILDSQDRRRSLLETLEDHPWVPGTQDIVRAALPKSNPTTSPTAAKPDKVYAYLVRGQRGPCVHLCGQWLEFNASNSEVAVVEITDVVTDQAELAMAMRAAEIVELSQIVQDEIILPDSPQVRVSLQDGRITLDGTQMEEASTPERLFASPLLYGVRYGLEHLKVLHERHDSFVMMDNIVCLQSVARPQESLYLIKHEDAVYTLNKAPGRCELTHHPRVEDLAEELSQEYQYDLSEFVSTKVLEAHHTSGWEEKLQENIFTLEIEEVESTLKMIKENVDIINKMGEDTAEKLYKKAEKNLRALYKKRQAVRSRR